MSSVLAMEPVPRDKKGAAPGGDGPVGHVITYADVLGAPARNVAYVERELPPRTRNADDGKTVTIFRDRDVPFTGRCGRTGPAPAGCRRRTGGRRAAHGGAVSPNRRDRVPGARCRWG